MLLIFVVLGMGPRTQCMLGNCPTIEWNPSLELHPSWPRTCDARIEVCTSRGSGFVCVTVSCCSVTN